jgi:hypothetical protein
MDRSPSSARSELNTSASPTRRRRPVDGADGQGSAGARRDGEVESTWPTIPCCDAGTQTPLPVAAGLLSSEPFARCGTASRDEVGLRTAPNGSICSRAVGMRSPRYPPPPGGGLLVPAIHVPNDGMPDGSLRREDSRLDLTRRQGIRQTTPIFLGVLSSSCVGVVQAFGPLSGYSRRDDQPCWLSLKALWSGSGTENPAAASVRLAAVVVVLAGGTVTVYATGGTQFGWPISCIFRWCWPG